MTALVGRSINTATDAAWKRKKSWWRIPKPSASARSIPCMRCSAAIGPWNLMRSPGRRWTRERLSCASRPAAPTTTSLRPPWRSGGTPRRCSSWCATRPMRRTKIRPRFAGSMRSWSAVFWGIRMCLRMSNGPEPVRWLRIRPLLPLRSRLLPEPGRSAPAAARFIPCIPTGHCRWPGMR